MIDPEVARQAARWRPIFDAADGGLFELPDRVAQLRAAALRLERQALPAPPDDPVFGLVEEVAVSGALPALAGIGETVATFDRARRGYDVAVRVLLDARHQVAARLSTAVAVDVADIHDRMRAAFDAAVGDARDAVKVVGPAAPDERQVLEGSDAERAAWVQLADLAATVDGIRAARGRLADVGWSPELDDEGLFARCRHPERSGLNIRRHPRWHEQVGGDPRGRLHFEVAHDVELWLPTPDEQDHRYAVFLLAQRQGPAGPYRRRLLQLVGYDPLAGGNPMAGVAGQLRPDPEPEPEPEP